jgi:hypothetical protein
VEENVLLFTDGINLRFHTSPAERPSKHQLLVEFSDRTALTPAWQCTAGCGASAAGRM